MYQQCTSNSSQARMKLPCCVWHLQIRDDLFSLIIVTRVCKIKQCQTWSSLIAGLNDENEIYCSSEILFLGTRRNPVVSSCNNWQESWPRNFRGNETKRKFIRFLIFFITCRCEHHKMLFALSHSQHQSCILKVALFKAAVVLCPGCAHNSISPRSRVLTWLTKWMWNMLAFLFFIPSQYSVYVFLLAAQSVPASSDEKWWIVTTLREGRESEIFSAAATIISESEIKKLEKASCLLWLDQSAVSQVSSSSQIMILESVLTFLHWEKSHKGSSWRWTWHSKCPTCIGHSFY